MNKNRISLLIFISIFTIVIFYCFFNNLIYKQTEKVFYTKVLQIIAISVENNPKIEKELLLSLKENNNSDIDKGEKILKKYGYNEGFTDYYTRRFTIMIFSTFILIFLLIFSFVIILKYFYRNMCKRINDLTEYLCEINEGNYKIKLYGKEDVFTTLEDELYKTVVRLKESHKNELNKKEKLSNNLADISHQLKTPLTSISLMIELLEDNSLSNEEKLYIKGISSQIQRLNHLVKSLLTLSKLDAGTLILKYNPIDVYELLQTATEPLYLMIEKKNQTLYIEKHNDVIFHGDFYWISEAILNIIKNCSEHTQKKGSIYIDYMQNPIFTQITIEDNGNGIAKKDIPHLFTRFYKGENSTKDSVGIGLSLSKSIIKKQNGDIRVKNIKNSGAQFIIKFYSKFS